MERAHYSNDDIVRLILEVFARFDRIERARDFDACQEYLRVPDVAELLGVSEPTVRAFIRDGKLIASKPGAHYLIPKSSIGRLLESYRVDKSGANGRKRRKPSESERPSAD